ncbi:hypothetical protein PV327_001638 [Microctonus hyperodae]|uniref:Uncharacterized protein n=1 Tax=Microctonus hyperodae TaxID=165561 RepID=A0AA39FDW9_MICHY|nr:hypothetical protein PV327_001638 [Microctonus hyperodae]
MWKLNVPFLNILAFSCDNASVMIGKYESFKQKLEAMNKNVLTFRCPCHSAALVAHNACNVNSDFEFQLTKFHKCANEIYLGPDCEEYLNDIKNDGHDSIVTETVLLTDESLHEKLNALLNKYADNAGKFCIAVSSNANESLNKKQNATVCQNPLILGLLVLY